jgi:hypothetical protein
MTNLSCHHFHDHPGAKRNKSVIPHQKLFQTVEMGGRKGEIALKPKQEDEADQQSPKDDELRQIRQSGDRRPRRRSNRPQTSANRQEIESET